MEITIKITGGKVSVEVSSEVADCCDQFNRKAENLSHEKRRHWDDRAFDEYIVATEGLLPYQPTPEDIVCQRETLALLVSVLDSCTAVQRERFLLYALYGFTYEEIGKLSNCSKSSVQSSIEAVRKKFLTFFKKGPYNSLF